MRIGTSSKLSTGVAMCLQARSPWHQSNRMPWWGLARSLRRPLSHLRCQPACPPGARRAGSGRTGSRMIAPGDKAEPVVDVIDDDPDIRDALRGLLRAVGLRAESFASVQEFLDSAPADLP